MYGWIIIYLTDPLLLDIQVIYSFPRLQMELQ